MKRIPHWIGGKVTPGTSGRTGPVYDPATGAQTGEVDLASVEEVDAAVEEATGAFHAWRSASLSQRTEVLFRFRELVDRHRADLAAAITAEHGKVLSDAGGEVARALEVVEFACGLADHLKGSYSEQVSTGIDVYSIRQPLGVVAGITPFNFPVMVPLWMVSNAIACGNAFVLKPSEKDPSPSLLLGELLAEAGVPDGVFNVVHGDRVAVNAILEHPGIAAVSFVGSTPIAKHVYQTGTRAGKRVQALGGAKNHMVVLPDADVDAAADAAVSAAYGSAGERCMAISVVVAVGDVADPLVAAISSRLPKLRIGPGTDPDSEMGPLVTGEHRDKVAGYVNRGYDEGATIVVDGRQRTFEGDGFFLGASLLDNVTTDMDVYRDEIFGPVLSVVRAASYEEAVRLVDENPYGNGTAIFTRDGGAARRFQFDVQAGMVGVNVPIPVPVASFSFGGWKSS
ncbi:MAG: CoA-acylating methylmalonate-semialdehyde dehydrogenase [Actinobacteria bacterium]|nr:MAG: CoA-acylating methylmalonate-semialdehyde dehydrogenase [Actinomycetota bacterium]